mmetsp:Transcript_4355/g.11393  ORF Transcript_4355/g.11393 Transcript_4355/m.11393 type:complete len:234 (+) Transcript_4355:1033-1734(+)
MLWLECLQLQLLGNSCEERLQQGWRQVLQRRERPERIGDGPGRKVGAGMHLNHFNERRELRAAEKSIAAGALLLVDDSETMQRSGDVDCIHLRALRGNEAEDLHGGLRSAQFQVNRCNGRYSGILRRIHVLCLRGRSLLLHDQPALRCDRILCRHGGHPQPQHSWTLPCECAVRHVHGAGGHPSCSGGHRRDNVQHDERGRLRFSVSPSSYRPRGRGSEVASSPAPEIFLAQS